MRIVIWLNVKPPFNKIVYSTLDYLTWALVFKSFYPSSLEYVEVIYDQEIYYFVPVLFIELHI